MTDAALYDELDLAVEKILAGRAVADDEFDPLVRELLPLADDLRLMPRADFRATLLAELENPRPAEIVPIRPEVLPSLFAAPWSYPVQRTNFAISALAHAAMLAFLCTSGLWMAHHPIATKQVTALLTDVSPSSLPPSTKTSAGGGGGGDRDKVSASHGSLPRAAREQITPPAIVVRNEAPKLAVEPTVVAPPLPISKLDTGDPLSAFNMPSNGPGTGGGIGYGNGGGVGVGSDPGVGNGVGGGVGGGLYRIGNGVSAPRAIFTPEPQYSDEARKAKMQGTVMLSIVVGADGRTRDVRVARSLGMGLDEKAIEAVKQWKFAPAVKDGIPVAVLVNVEVNFRLY